VLKARRRGRAAVARMAAPCLRLPLGFLDTQHGSDDWNSKAFSWLTGTFLFVTGIALGKGGVETRRGT
jgi:hypothetical protein